jgi:hypothetical protein
MASKEFNKMLKERKSTIQQLFEEYNVMFGKVKSRNISYRDFNKQSNYVDFILFIISKEFEIIPDIRQFTDIIDTIIQNVKKGRKSTDVNSFFYRTVVSSARSTDFVKDKTETIKIEEPEPQPQQEQEPQPFMTFPETQPIEPGSITVTPPEQEPQPFMTFPETQPIEPGSITVTPPEQEPQPFMTFPETQPIEPGSITKVHDDDMIKKQRENLEDEIKDLNKQFIDLKKKVKSPMFDPDIFNYDFETLKLKELKLLNDRLKTFSERLLINTGQFHDEDVKNKLDSIFKQQIDQIVDPNLKLAVIKQSTKLLSQKREKPLTEDDFVNLQGKLKAIIEKQREKVGEQIKNAQGKQEDDDVFVLDPRDVVFFDSVDDIVTEFVAGSTFMEFKTIDDQMVFIPKKLVDVYNLYHDINTTPETKQLIRDEIKDLHDRGKVNFETMNDFFKKRDLDEKLKEIIRNADPKTARRIINEMRLKGKISKQEADKMLFLLKPATKAKKQKEGNKIINIIKPEPRILQKSFS